MSFTIALLLESKQPQRHVTNRSFLDTNILLYSISREENEATKQEIALRLLDEENHVLSVQVLQEFYHQATRPNRPNNITAEFAWGLISGWRRFPIQEQTFDLLESAHELRLQTKYSIWDSLIIAAAQAQGCAILYTEDMQHGHVIDDLRIVNPFRQGAIIR